MEQSFPKEIPDTEGPRIRGYDGVVHSIAHSGAGYVARIVETVCYLALPEQNINAGVVRACRTRDQLTCLVCIGA